MLIDYPINHLIPLNKASIFVYHITSMDVDRESCIKHFSLPNLKLTNYKNPTNIVLRKSEPLSKT